MINWGIVGLGKMASQFANSIKNVNNSKLIAVASRSKKKLKEFANKFDLDEKKLFLSYEDLLGNKNIDAVYISTLNNTHLDLIINAAKKEKKILCEKPLGLNLNEVIQAKKILKRYNINFFEAIAYRSHPQTDALLTFLKKNELGKIFRIESSFGFRVKKIRHTSRLFNKNLGGGSILDLGCYPVSFFNLFSDKNNKLQFIDSKIEFLDTGVDVDAKINLKLGSSIDLVGHVSLKKNLDNICKIYCEKGSIKIPSPWLPSQKSFIEIAGNNHYYKSFTNIKNDIYSNQIEKISNNFLDKKNQNYNSLVDIEESYEIMLILDKWMKNKKSN